MRTAEAERPGAGEFGFSTSCCSLGSQSAEHKPLLVTLKISLEIHVVMSPNLRNIEKKTPGKGLGYQRDEDSQQLFVSPSPYGASQVTSCELFLGHNCRKRAKCWFGEPDTVTVGIPGRKASKERARSQTGCPAQSLPHPVTLPPQNHDHSKIPSQRQLTNKEENSAPSGQPECYKKSTLSAVLSHGWKPMAEESSRAKLSKGFREGRIMVRPELCYHGAKGGDKKMGLGYECLNVLD